MMSMAEWLKDYLTTFGTPPGQLIWCIVVHDKANEQHLHDDLLIRVRNSLLSIIPALLPQEAAENISCSGPRGN
jgi:hypothetical protein